VVTHQLQVERRTAKAHRPKTDALPLDYATTMTFKWPHISVLGDATVTWLGTLVVYTVYVDMTLTQSKVKVTGPLNFHHLAKLCMLAAMTAAPLWGFLV